MVATRKKPDLNIFDCHAFLQFYFRLSDGNWKVCDVGVCGDRFPQGILDGIQLFCATTKRKVCVLDQNGYYTHRQQGAIPFFPTEEEKEKILKYIFRMMTEEGSFQFVGKNCAYQVQKIMNKFFPHSKNFFKISITNQKQV